MTAELDPPDRLDALIDRVRRSEPPAAGWPRARRRAARRRRRRVALAALTVLAVATGVWELTRHPPADRPVEAPFKFAAAPVPAPEPAPPPGPDIITDESAAVPLPVDQGLEGQPTRKDGVFGASPVPGGLQPGPRGGAMAGVWPSPRLAVASAAPVFVSTGGAEPIRMGGTVPAGTVGERIHVWNWDRSPDSRVLTTTYTGPVTLTPDGTTLLTADGRAVDLATDKAAPLPWWGDGGPDGPPGLKLRPRWAAFSPDGKTLLAFEHDEKVGTARLIDYPAGTERARIGGLWWAASKAAFTPDGKTVALFGSDAHLRAFDAATGKEKVRFAPPFGNTIAAVAVSPDGSRVAGSYQDAVRVWDAATGRLVCEPDTKGGGPLAWVSALTFSPDGTRLAGGGTGRLVLWDAAEGKLLHRYPAESNIVGRIRFDAAGAVMTTVKDFYIHGSRNGREETVYPTVDRWRTDAPARAAAP